MNDDDTGAEWLLLDRRAALRGKAGLHALIIGVSEYEHLPAADDPPEEESMGMQRLTFAATSACQLYQKLCALDEENRLERPLKSARVLVVPSSCEQCDIPIAVPRLETLRKAIKAWQADTAENVEQGSFFYFVGHGLRTDSEDSILLASDFLEDEQSMLRHSFRLSNIRNGMAPSKERPDMGLHQCYFVDACRETPRSQADRIKLIDHEPERILATPMNLEDGRAAPTYFATPAGGKAAGEDCKASYFVKALLWALDHGSARRDQAADCSERRWPVEASNLEAAIKCGSPRFANQLDTKGRVGDSTLCYALDPPRLDLHIGLHPEEKCDNVASGMLHPAMAHHAPLPVDTKAQNPCLVPGVPSGIYNLELRSEVDGAPPQRLDPELININLRMPWRVRVTL